MNLEFIDWLKSNSARLAEDYCVPFSIIEGEDYSYVTCESDEDYDFLFKMFKEESNL